MKLRPEHVAEEWDEGEDGYWIALKSGWKWDGDVVGAVHSIHEPTKRLAYREGVMPCHCTDCTSETFPCRCGGEIIVESETAVVHRCKLLAHQKQFGEMPVRHVRIQLNPTITGGQRRFRWFVDWQSNPMLKSSQVA